MQIIKNKTLNIIQCNTKYFSCCFDVKEFSSIENSFFYNCKFEYISVFSNLSGCRFENCSSDEFNLIVSYPNKSILKNIHKIPVTNLQVECELDEFPSQILKISNLVEFAYTGRFFQEISKMHSLQRLMIPFVGLTTLPEDIYQFRNLTHLVLRGNQIDSISKGISKLKRLEYLDLQGNKLTTLPKEISELISLKRLYLSLNFMFGEEKKQIRSYLPNCCIQF
ncbi:leucine-rich repeat domain-containing protein [Candidatus Uabimicrobium sp. HlEnr_7]|uniref:leucine-rich repeat domain-containing protein n=1 Tax=Candidatus Uabimicrobium helgolandensis TaxID=3095367 RepID=UPI0035563E2E